MSDFYISEDIKGKVTALLMESEWTQEPNVNLSVLELEAWDKYRQEVRLSRRNLSRRTSNRTMCRKSNMAKETRGIINEICIKISNISNVFNCSNFINNIASERRK